MKSIHPDIHNKNIRSIYELSASFNGFAQDEGRIDGDTLWARIVEAIQARHGQATPVIYPDHPRPLWKLDLADIYFYYQVLPDEVEVGDIVGKTTPTAFEPTQDLLAEFTGKLP